MPFRDPWGHRNAKRLMGCFQAAVKLESAINEDVIPDPERAEKALRMLEEVRRLGSVGRQKILTTGPEGRAVAALVREMEDKLNEVLGYLEG